MALNGTALNALANHLASLVGRLTVHSGDPGAAGTANTTTAGHQTPTWATASSGRLNLATSVAFTGGAPSGPCTHVGLWSADGTVFYGPYALTGDQTFDASGGYTLNSISLTGAAT